MKKLGLSRDEVGELNFKQFFELYECYKQDFDLEMQMTKNCITYEKLNSNTSNHGAENTVSW